MSFMHARCGSACLLGGPRPFALSGTPRVYERPRPFNVRHLSLEIELDPAGKAIDGTATLDVERVDPSATELCLDAVSVEIREVALLDGKRRPGKYVYDGDTLRVAIAPEKRVARVRVA